jgi:hypothetical protein
VRTMTLGEYQEMMLCECNALCIMHNAQGIRHKAWRVCVEGRIH